MRVIAGSAGGVRLAPVPRGVRPVSDMAREGVFSSLGDEVVGSRVLDLYAGTGAMGIEALSRGAAHVVFVERGRAAQRTIHENLRRIAAVDRASVVGSDVRGFLAREGGDRFDLVLADPPYDTSPGEVEAVLRRLEASWVATPEGTVVLTRPGHGRAGEPPLPEGWRVARRLTYGDTLVLVCRGAGHGPTTP